MANIGKVFDQDSCAKHGCKTKAIQVVYVGTRSTILSKTDSTCYLTADSSGFESRCF